MTVKEIPYEFISQRVPMTWADIQFGLDNQLLRPKAAIDKATEQLCDTDAAPRGVVELAIRVESESVIDLVSDLAKAEARSSDDVVKAKWLYIVLAWLFENRKSLVNPLEIVEEVYSDFDYPAQIASFIRYMPIQGPNLGSREKNEARMFDRWKAYLDEEQKRFGRSS
ncbi:MAG TPA: DUF2247 family protein [Verrucomicrobiae bacterium]|jgi:hypothetical protein|nr:DUF2247 family protein [Verrucomicrobiae bacterium]